MILLDTNVLSAVVSGEGDDRVAQWLAAQPADELATTTVTAYELWRGVRRLPAGRRRSRLQADVDVVLRDILGDRFVAFDQDAADAAATLDAERKGLGIVVGPADTLIAGIAVSRRATLATRNVRHFADLPTPVVDPWAA